MNDIQIFNNSEFGEIRTVNIDGEAWFVAKDISEKLGYVKPANMVKLIDDDDKQTIESSKMELPTNPNSRLTSIINESGLYAAIFGSKQDNAKKFKKWVTSEVIPAIRKTGGYSLPTTTAGQIQLLAKGHVELEKKIEAVDNKLTETQDSFKEFQDNCPMFPIEADQITKEAKRKGVSVMGGKHSRAYHDRCICNAVYKDIYGEIHRNFDCNSYKAIPRKHVPKVLEVINSYSLPIILQERVDEANNEIA